MPQIACDGTNGFTVASVERRFDVGRMVDEYLALYEAVVARGGASQQPACSLRPRPGL
jgi:hypothetical protein